MKLTHTHQTRFNIKIPAASRRRIRKVVGRLLRRRPDPLRRSRSTFENAASGGLLDPNKIKSTGLLKLTAIATMSLGLTAGRAEIASTSDSDQASSSIGWDDLPKIMENIVPPTFPDKDFSITDYGAVADNSSDIKPAIDEAISKANAAGGGRVLVPAGDWFIAGPIHLKSNVNLHVADGATINFSTVPSDYEPLVYTRYEGTELMNYSPLIYAYEQENIAITGKGTFHGRASTDNWWGDWRRKSENIHKARQMAEDGIPARERVFGNDTGMRPVFVQPYKCKNILIEGVTFRDSPMWFVNPVLCENITVRDMTVIGLGPNNDGCNPESSKNVLIEGCYFDTGDDCIAIKSGRNADGRNIGVPTENVIIRNCKMLEGHGGVVVGSEMSGGVRNVFAEDCVMDSPHLERALRIKSNTFRGGFVENIHFRNVTVSEVADAAFRINLYYWGENGDHYPTVRNVSMENVVVEKAPRAFYFHGREELPIQDVLVKNCQFNNISQPSVITGIENLKFENVQINGLPKDQ